MTNKTRLGTGLMIAGAILLDGALLRKTLMWLAQAIPLTPMGRLRDTGWISPVSGVLMIVGLTLGVRGAKDRSDKVRLGIGLMIAGAILLNGTLLQETLIWLTPNVTLLTDSNVMPWTAGGMILTGLVVAVYGAGKKPQDEDGEIHR